MKKFGKCGLLVKDSSGIPEEVRNKIYHDAFMELAEKGFDINDSENEEDIRSSFRDSIFVISGLYYEDRTTESDEEEGYIRYEYVDWANM